MKKLLLLIAFITVTLASRTQDDRKTDDKKDFVMMKEGKMMVTRNGKTIAMDKEMTLSDGTRVMPDGKVMMPDGSTKILKNGESLSMDGKAGKGKKKEGS